MVGVKESTLLSKFMKQDKDFSIFYKEMIEEEETGNSISFYGKTPQGTINPEIEEGDDEEDEFKVEDPSNDYKMDKENIKIYKNQG